MSTGDRERGLYAKYEVQRREDSDGKHDNCRYFVLDPQHDPAARVALATYAREIADEYPELWGDLIEWLIQL